MRFYPFSAPAKLSRHHRTNLRVIRRGVFLTCIATYMAVHVQRRKVRSTLDQSMPSGYAMCTHRLTNNAHSPASVRVGVLAQVGNWGLWEELATGCIDHVIETVDTAFILVSSHVEGKEQLVGARYDCAKVITVPNHGADIAPFFTELHQIGQHLEDVNFIIKLHTKTNDAWRKGMIHPICGTSSAVRQSLETFRSDPKLGMLGALNYTYFIDSNDEGIIKNRLANQYHFNTSFYAMFDEISKVSHFDEDFYAKWRGNSDLKSLTRQELVNHFHQHGRSERRIFSKSMQEYLESSGYPQFIAGTIFWFRAAPMVDFLHRYRAKEIANSMRSESGYFRDESVDRVTHAWERCVSLVFHSQGYKLAGVS